MLVSDFYYDLPPELIAQHPPAVRGASRMLALDRRTGTVADHPFAELPHLLRPGDLLVLNDSRVLPGRLYATREGLSTQLNSSRPSGLIEVLLTEHLPSPDGRNDWRVLVRPAKKVQQGETLDFAAVPGGTPLLRATVLSAGDFGERVIRFAPAKDFIAIVERIGHMPLPPYIHRDKREPDTVEDRERYQTIYSRQSGSAAAPTAGLHFTPEILSQLVAHGIEVTYITLHVGLGTFQPVRVENTRDIQLHAESYTLAAEAARSLNEAYRSGRRIVAVGTTTTRTLEHLARTFESAHGQLSPSNPLALQAHSGSTSLFLSPAADGDDEFKLVRGLLTNFHLPESTLLMLVSAFAGRETVLRAYAHAVSERYRFFSYGDCMLIT
ncbi:MAG TPA: tRNA preQ1(34) S-adenosylmethionine ribosyltransferase-isomerase QueA [Candidatus Aquilonibacter sp.]|nr:tRNA preQ1(34) S-adenosylmethionine ribosyltransferase-isomerase QueA [Candidatus Aquilonibacter sp.]